MKKDDTAIERVITGELAEVKRVLVHISELTPSTSGSPACCPHFDSL
jgi:hypothetical protein